MYKKQVKTAAICEQDVKKLQKFWSHFSIVGIARVKIFQELRLFF